MEKRALLAIGLSVAVMALWQYFFAPQLAPVPAQPSAPISGPASPLQNNEGDRAELPAVPSVAPTTTGTGKGPAAVAVEAAAREEFRLLSTTQDIRFSNEGGSATRWRLTRYSTHEGDPVDLIPDGAAAATVLPLQVEIAGEPELTRRLAAALHTHEIARVGGDDPSGLGPAQKLTLRWANEEGLSVRKSITLPDDGYVMAVELEVTRGGKPLPASLVLAAGLTERADESTGRYGNVEGDFVLHDGREVLRTTAASLERRVQFAGSTGTPVRWAGLETTYFAALVLPPADAASRETSVIVTPLGKPSNDRKGAPPLIAAALASEGIGSWRLFVGPKDHQILAGLGSDLDHVIDFSRFSLIYAVTKGLFIALTAIKSYVGNYGWAIILLTILVRVAFFPITYKSAITMRQTSRRMARIQPKVKAIQERYRKMKKSLETQRKQNEEVMALYKKEGINPMSNLGGCLPLLLQMPVFIAFYNLLAVTIELRQAPFFGWIHDLSNRDPYYISPILMGASWLVQQAMTSSSIPDPMQRRMMYLMPVMFTFFMMNMPSGLVVYWFMNNVLGIAQQYITNRKADAMDAAAKAGDGSIAGSRRVENGQTA